MLKTLDKPVAAKVTEVQAPTCPYCGEGSELASSLEVYHKDYGPIYICRPCQAWVGCHMGTVRPLGRLANAELRKAKQAAHKAFDPLWMKGYMDRRDAYAWLVGRLGVPGTLCHIGIMDVEGCLKVIEVCQNLPMIYRVVDEDDKVAAIVMDHEDRVQYARGFAKVFLKLKMRSVSSMARKNGWEVIPISL